MLDRLIGLETEYAIGDAEHGPANRPRYLHFRAIVSELRKRLPLAVARHFKDGVFLATGGALWFESERPSSGCGLIEGSTPECRGVTALMAYQRAQDSLLAEAASQVSEPFWLLKNDRDAVGNFYGAQENYEADLASGWRLAVWRLGLIALLPLLLATWLVFLALIVLLLGYFLVVGLLRPVLRDHPAAQSALYGRPEFGAPTPAWLEPLLLWVIRVVNAPLSIGLWLLCRCCAFFEIRRRLMALLVTRCIVSGAGLVDQKGAFQLADKAGGINCEVGFGGYFFDRPLFTMGHFFKALCIESMFSPRAFLGLFRRRQRLQIGLGDSNMAEVSEFLRIGTTLLVIDAIENKALGGVPRLRHPLAALRAFVGDPSLRIRQPIRGGGLRSALEIQQEYLQACRDFVCGQNVDMDHEAWTVLRYWADCLEDLGRYADSGEMPPTLLGRLDWATKRHLLKTAVQGDPWSHAKKIDLRYHELTPEGYFQRLQAEGLVHAILQPEQILRARRSPPVDTQAGRRGRLIREFSGDRTQVRANWSNVYIHDGKTTRVIRLRDPGKGPGQSPSKKRTPPKLRT